MDLLDQHPRFKIPSIRAPLKSTLEVDADLVGETVGGASVPSPTLMQLMKIRLIRPVIPCHKINI